MTQTTTTIALQTIDRAPSHYARLLSVAENLTGAAKDEVLVGWVH